MMNHRFDASLWKQLLMDCMRDSGKLRTYPISSDHTRKCCQITYASKWTDQSLKLTRSIFTKEVVQGDTIYAASTCMQKAKSALLKRRGDRRVALEVAYHAASKWTTTSVSKGGKGNVTSSYIPRSARWNLAASSGLLRISSKGHWIGFCFSLLGQDCNRGWIMEILAKQEASSIIRCFRTDTCVVRNPKIIRDPFSRNSCHTTFPSLYLYHPLAI